MIFTRSGTSYRVDEDGDLWRYSDLRSKWVYLGQPGYDYPYLSDYLF